MYRLKLSRREKKKLSRMRWLIVLVALVLVVLGVWLVWIRPMQRGSGVRSYAECVAAGNPVQESYPEVCLTRDGKRFVNPAQQAAHQASLDDTADLRPPTNPGLLNLDIEEWGVRIPLTAQTFDLSYAYFDLNGEQHILFTYKRLVQKGVCTGDIGLKLTRLTLKREPPYTLTNPAPIAQLGNFYYYVIYPEGEAAKPCYDEKNAEQVALVKAIAGDQTLAQTTTNLAAKLVIMPEE